LRRKGIFCVNVIRAVFSSPFLCDHNNLIKKTLALSPRVSSSLYRDPIFPERFAAGTYGPNAISE
jgi:hypothetical protein